MVNPTLTSFDAKGLIGLPKIQQKIISSSLISFVPRPVPSFRAFYAGTCFPFWAFSCSPESGHEFYFHPRCSS